MRQKYMFSLLVLLISATQFIFAQELSVSGKVMDAAGAALPWVNVLVKGTNKGGVTDFDGNYEILASRGDVLVFSSVGFANKEVTVSENTVNVSLAEDSNELEEVVVTALGITREKKSLGYSVQDVKGDKVAETSPTNVVSALQGRVAGAQIITASGQVGASSSITIRGDKSLKGSSQPLFVVDGTPIQNGTSSALLTKR